MPSPLDRVLPVRVDDPLLAALERARATLAPPGVRLTRSDAIRALLWRALRDAGVVPPEAPSAERAA